MSISIKIENLSKQYRLGLVSTHTLTHDLNRWWQTNILGNEDPYLIIGDENKRDLKGESEYVWALKNVNLVVEQGEVLGIIGKNGAGKSTLLKILSKVTAPTTGTIKTKGRIASLLEVGTGFHYEMTGRENIYMNGAIMGMNKAEINRKLDEIIDFAGVERYIDTPVKRYSSGMIVRLGFAVAAHLEPEILVVDEVLAVGDVEFQKKAIGKMQDVSHAQGRTILFVSHNMGAIRSLCSKSLILNDGRICILTNTEEAINKYLALFNTNSLEFKSIKTTDLFIASARLVNEKNNTTNLFDFGESLSSEIVINTKRKTLKGIHLAIALQNKYKNRVFSSDHILDDLRIDNRTEIKINFEFPNLPYAPGIYSINLGLHVPNVNIIELYDEILPFEIIDKGSNLSKYRAFTGDMLIDGKIYSF